MGARGTPRARSTTATSRNIDFLNRIYATQSQANQLHSDLWPSAAKFEAEIVSMTAHMLSAEATGAPFDSEHGVCGSVSSGGLGEHPPGDEDLSRLGPATSAELLSPSLSCRARRMRRFTSRRSISISSWSRCRWTSSFRADVDALPAAITENTIAVVASAPNFPYGHD